MGFSAERHHLHRTEKGILQYLKHHEEGSFVGLTLKSASTQPGNTTLIGMLLVGIAGCRKALLPSAIKSIFYGLGGTGKSRRDNAKVICARLKNR